MNNKVTYTILASLIFAYSLSNVFVFNHFQNNISSFEYSNHKTDNTEKVKTPDQYAINEFQVLDTFIFDSEIDFDNNPQVSKYDAFQSFEPFRISKDLNYFQKGKLIIPSLSKQKLIFPFHYYI